MEGRNRLGLDVIEHASAARHRAGVPVLELAARDEHHRVLVVRALVGRNQVRGTNLPRPVVVGKCVTNTTGSPGSPSFSHG